MPDVYDAAKRSAVMRAVRSRGTKPERVVEAALLELGLGFEPHAVDLPGRPDFVLPENRIALFVNGCFWHQHEGCKRSALPVTDHDRWAAKLGRNRVRDREHAKSLTGLGWRPLTVWECQATTLAKARTVVVNLIQR